MTFLHLLTSIFESNFKPSKFYYDLSTKVQRFIMDWSKSNRFVGILNDHLFRCKERESDDSTFLQWQTRFALDLSCQVLVAFPTVIILSLFVVGTGLENMALNSEKGLYYNYITVMVTAIQLVITVFFNAKWNGVCFLSPIISLWDKHKWEFILAIVACVMIAIQVPGRQVKDGKV